MSVTERDAATIRDCVHILRHGRTLARDESTPRYIGRQDSRVEFSAARRELYSYGTHFPLARYVPGGRGRPSGWIINGDRWRRPRSRTSAHQSATREAIAATAEACGDWTIVLPFPTLDAAGLDLDTVRPGAVRPDSNWT
jgi:hypothetical protein